MKSITITNIPHELYHKIEERAKANNRSANTEIRQAINQGRP